MVQLRQSDTGLNTANLIMYQISFRVCFYARYFAQWWRNHWA